MKLYEGEDGYYLESKLDLSKTILSGNGYEGLHKEKNIMPFMCPFGVDDWLNEKAMPKDVKRITSILKPIIIELWKEGKLEKYEWA